MEDGIEQHTSMLLNHVQIDRSLNREENVEENENLCIYLMNKVKRYIRLFYDPYNLF